MVHEDGHEVQDFGTVGFRRSGGLGTYDINDIRVKYYLTVLSMIFTTYEYVLLL